MNTNILAKLEAVFSQASTIQSTQFFFQLLHEFTSELLQNNDLRAHLQTIRDQEQKLKQWIDKIPTPPSRVLLSLSDKDRKIEEKAIQDREIENKKIYFAQRKTTAAWYALNQLTVFFERYDFVHHDTVIRALTAQGIDTTQFQKEHEELMKYVISGTCSGALFPTIEEYLQYMRRVLDALRVSDNILSVEVYPFKFEEHTSTLFITDHKPIRYSRSKNPSVLLNYMQEQNWKSVEWDSVEKDIGLDHDETKRAIRQVNDRIPESLPRFLRPCDHPDTIGKKIIAVSLSYKLIKL